jgi:hypothetical protein
MSDDTPTTDALLAQAVIDNFHCPDDKHSSWWLNTDELRHAFVPILAAHDESVRAEERERIARNIEAHAATDYQTRRLAYENAARIARKGA